MISTSARSIVLIVATLSLSGQAICACPIGAVNIQPSDGSRISGSWRVSYEGATCQGATAHLVGDWSVSGVTQHNLDTLSAALQQIEPTGAGKAADRLPPGARP